MWYASGRGEVHAKFWWETPRKMYHLEVGRPSRVWEGYTGMDIKRPDGRMWTGMIWFLKRTSDGLL
jgi:hypothetical protein